jgi:hypothetical protein
MTTLHDRPVRVFICDEDVVLSAAAQLGPIGHSLSDAACGERAEAYCGAVTCDSTSTQCYGSDGCRGDTRTSSTLLSRPRRWVPRAEDLMC